FEGGSFGTTTGAMYAVKYDDFDGYILQAGKLGGYSNLPTVNLKNIKKPIFIMGNILDNNVPAANYAKQYIEQQLDKGRVYFTLEKYWNELLTTTIVKKDNGVLYPKSVMVNGHDISVEGYNKTIDFILNNKPSKPLGVAQAWYAVLMGDKQNSVAKF